MRVRRAAVLVLSALILPGCGVDDGVVASVGSRQVTQAEFQVFLADEASVEWQAADARVASRLLDRFLGQLALLSEADLADGSWSPAERRQNLQRAVREVCGEPPAPDAAAVAAEIDRRMALVHPRKVLARQILVDDEASAKEVYERIMAGESFELVSATVSRAPNAEGGGLIGWVEEHSLLEALDSVLFSLEVGEVSRPVAGPGDYHVFQVMDAREAGAPDRAAVERAVHGEFQSRVSGDHVRECYERVCRDVGIKIHADHLWFAYGGRFAEDGNGSK
jgi:hypothetical protein